VEDSAPVTDALLAKWKAGDRDAFLVAVGPWQDRIFRIVYRIVGTSHDAEEVWQTLMLRLLRCELPLPEATAFPAWLRRCAVNAAISFLRNRKRVIEQPGQSDAIGETPSAEPAPPEALAEAELRERLHDELSRMSPEQRAMLALRYDECLTVREIAAVLEIPHSTIQFQLGKAIECLRRRFAVMERKQERVSDG
jgi:RNA polymerase sigma-70 factor, ECF subfamily